MIGNILDNTTELYMMKYAFGEIFSSGGATLCKNPSDQTVTRSYDFYKPVQKYQTGNMSLPYLSVNVVVKNMDSPFNINDFRSGENEEQYQTDL